MSNMHTKSVREAYLTALAAKSTETAKAVSKIAATMRTK